MATVNGVAPTNTLDALLNIVRHPAANVAANYTLAMSTNPSQALPAAPPDWTLAMTISGGGLAGPTALAVDDYGAVWVANEYSALSSFLPGGAPAFATGMTGTELNESYGIAIDANNNVWVTNDETGVNGNNGSVTEFNNSGQLSGGSAYTSGGLNYLSQWEPIVVAICGSRPTATPP